MAKLDDLIAQVHDERLRAELIAAADELRRKKRFGLVFEEHIPETTVLYGFPVRRGATVYERSDRALRLPLTVRDVVGEEALVSADRGHERRVPVRDLLVYKRFGDPIYAALTPLGPLRRGPADKPAHAVINGENFHALQLLIYAYEGQFDCIYIDPPYNTGARDWKYNNRYVDSADRWRHSKWLSHMEKRLQLARRLLAPNGVLIVTIDENELHHLGMLLERLFPEARRQAVTICINPSGVSGESLSRVDEYALFCFFGEAKPVRTPDDMLTGATEGGSYEIAWESLLRRGNAWYRELRPNLCYPIFVQPDTGRILGAGDPFEGEDESARPDSVDGMSVAWPVRRDGRLGIWRVDARRFTALAEQGYAYVTTRDETRGTWTVKYLMTGTIQGIEAGIINVVGRGDRGEVMLESTVARSAIAKTMWHRGRHTAGGAGGTQALAALLGERGLFPFPKSVYAVRDCLTVAIGDRREALILDFFAGSGTTFHATSLMNAEDGGNRRSILVTNNEVSETDARRLARAGHERGDEEFERHGIFERVTQPRCAAVVTGLRPDGQPAAGYHIDGRPYGDGFDESVEFFRLDYLDPDEIELGQQLEAILPALWLAAGSVGDWRGASRRSGFVMPKGAPFAVLLRESGFRAFAEALEARPDVTHVWLVTDSERAFVEMRAAITGERHIGMLYRDYLRNFRINTRQSA
jgi:adenine-specific DNA-methyltransferase